MLASPVEHHAVLDAVDWLAEHEGATVEYLPVDAYGRVHPEALREAIERDPERCRAGHRDVGQQRDRHRSCRSRELAECAAEFGVPLHADAVQAFGQLPVDFAASRLAAMTVAGHKIGGPYGVGALLLGREYTPVPVLHGGGQERHVRSGTLDVPAIASFAVAGALAAERREDFAREIGALRDELIAAVRTAVPEAILGGDPVGPASRQRPLHLPRLRGRLPAAAA